MKRLRVLMSAHEFSPEQGSECAVGWNIVTRMAAYHDVTVLCADGPPLHRDSYRNAVNRHMEEHGPIPGLRVVYVEQPHQTLRYARLNRRLMKFTRGVGWQALYFVGLDHWHRASLEQAHALGLNFDVVHQLTPISFLRPGYLWTTGIPFFWGPMGGMFKVPNALARAGGTSSLVFETIRSHNIERQILTKGFKETVNQAKRIWTVTEDERRVIEVLNPGTATPMLDTAPPEAVRGRVRSYDGNRPLRLCWSGRHEARKALPFLLHAIARLNAPERVRLDVLGEGELTPQWRALAEQLQLEGIITWHGRLPYHQALQLMDQADIFVHTSFREAASMVILEALGWGLPVICHDACGMAVAVNDSCGIKVPFVSPEQSIKGFGASVERFLLNPQLVERLSAGALRRASQLSWDAKVKEIAEAYALRQSDRHPVDLPRQ